MSIRPWLILFMLANYLLVVGLGCVNRPEDDPELVQILTHEEGHSYQQCRYLRMDGLEAFLEESLATRYQDAPQTPPNHLLTIVSGIHVHYLVGTTWQPVSPVPVEWPATPVVVSSSDLSEGIRSLIITPPWQA